MKKHLTQPTVPQEGFTPPRSLAGFTLVETLVAITILLLVVIGPMTVAQKGIQTAYHANSEITAVFLAQEAIEGVRHIRDEEALDASASAGDDETWNLPINSYCINTNGNAACAFSAGNFIPCPSNSPNCELQIDTSTGKYTHGSGAATPFRRRVYMKSFTGTNVLQVTVTVDWLSNIPGMGNKTITLQSFIYDQYAQY